MRIIPLAFVLTLACSSATEPRLGVTLLVTNGTCQADHCDPLRVLGFPSNQPRTPGGMWSVDLGTIATSQACFVLPPTATFRVTGARSDGGSETTTYKWSTMNSLSLGAIPVSSSTIQAGPSTAQFVPGIAPGWRVTVPGETKVTVSSACSP